MRQDTAREARLLVLVAVLLAIYGSTVASLAAANGQLGLLSLQGVGGPLAAIWVSSFAFIFCAYAVDMLVRRRPASPVRLMAAEMRGRIMRPDWLIARSTAIAAWFCLMTFFTPLKIMIAHVRGFPYDQAMMQIDRVLFFGRDPWVVTHALFGDAASTFVLQSAYSIWFVVMWIGLVYLVMRPEFVRLRAQYLVAFLLTWMLVGSLAAYFLASAGPCYYERAFGDPHFQPLMDRLHAIDARLTELGPAFGIHALRLQDMLWGAFTAERELLGGGISAMPSMHVAVAVLMACGGWQLNRLMGWALTVFALMIWIGSVHLGWHYAVDGIVGAGMALAIWYFSGWLVGRLVFRETPAGKLRPAFAE